VRDSVHIANPLLGSSIINVAQDNEPPGYWRVVDGLPVPLFSHPDATPLCRTGTDVVAEPIEAG